MTSAPRRPRRNEAAQRSRSERRTDVALETFEQDERPQGGTSRVVQDNPDGSARSLDPLTESREAAVDEA